MSDDGAQPSTVCRVCLKPLPVGASKCTECGSFQDFRRHVFQWSSVVGAVIALWPLWTGASALHELAFPGRPELAMVDLECQPSRVTWFIVNEGGSAALVHRPQVRTVEQDDTVIAIDFQLADGPRRVAADGIEYFAFDLRPGQKLLATTAAGDCRAVAALRIVTARTDDSAYSRSVEGSCPCPT